MTITHPSGKTTDGSVCDVRCYPSGSYIDVKHAAHASIGIDITHITSSDLSSGYLKVERWD